MPTPILATKLYIPPPRPNLVPRTHLVERLNGGLHGKLTLISAPAGFGKTTLVSDWITDGERSVAWLSLEDGDSDLTRFLTYLVAALRTVAGDLETGDLETVGFGEEVLALLQATQPPPSESILTTLLNEIASIPNNFILILDDYHLIDDNLIDDALTFLLDHLPPQMHLAITTREDPNLPLSRYRGRGQLTELRAADLRFTPDEAASFLDKSMGLTLAPDEIAALETRTEGWITGLQLAALSLQGRPEHGRNNIAAFIQAFTGSHHYILDYLIEEVLKHQPEHMRSFLLHTSILDRLTDPLCRAVAGDAFTSTVATEYEEKQSNRRGLLEALEHDNLFVIPLDEQRQWYRYHHLFADVLQARLMETQPELLPTLHQRASVWYAQHDLPADAIRHALAAKDFVSAAGLIELAWRPMDQSMQSATWLEWVQTLPDALVRSMPVLSVGYGWALLDSGKLEASESHFQDAERWLNATTKLNEQSDASHSGPSADLTTSGMIVVDEEEFESLAATIATARAFHAQAVGDFAGSIRYTEQALELMPEEDVMLRAPAIGLLGIAQWASGDLNAAYQTFADFMASMEATGNIIFAISATHGTADLKIQQGCLRDAEAIYQHALDLAKKEGEPWPVGTANLYLGLAELYREYGELEAAIEFMGKSEELGSSAALPGWPFHIYLAQARMKESQGDLDGAIDLLDEAARRYQRSPMPDIRPIASLKTRVWLKQGRLSEALGWVRERGLSVDDDLSYLHEFDYITLARVLMADYQDKQHQRKQDSPKPDAIHAVMGLLKRLLQSTDAGGRVGYTIEVLVLQALLYDAKGNTRASLASLERALTLAKPNGFVRIFVDEGEPMKGLLAKAVADELMPDYANKLLAAFAAKSPVNASRSLPHSTSASATQPLVEPLSPRELEVLHLISEGLSNQEICDRLFLALSSVKGHNRNIFGKLQVQRRTEAVARARELGLV